jgi:hypothetical protein
LADGFRFLGTVMFHPCPGAADVFVPVVRASA